MENLLSHAITFLIGAATGATGSYFATKYTDRRRTKEDSRNERKQFKEICREMPELISEMHNDLIQPSNKHIREFFVTTSKAIFGFASPSFRYHEDEHYNLRGKIAILENLGYVYDVTPGNCPKYRMTEEFVKLVMNFK